MSSFAEQVRACTTYGRLALALAAEFRPVRAVEAEAVLAGMADLLGGARHDAAAEQLALTGTLLGDRLSVTELDTWIDDLLLDRVLLGGGGHPLLLAVAGAEAAHRAGLPIGVIAGGPGVFLAHRCVGEPIGADCAADGQIVDLSAVAHELRWQCPHQIAARLLNGIAERAGRCAHLADELRAAELRLLLPFDREIRVGLERELARVRARLN